MLLNLLLLIAFVMMLFAIVIGVTRLLSGELGARRRLPQTFDSLFDGRPQVVYRVPPRITTVHEVIEAAQQRGYDVTHQVPDGSTATLTFAHRG
jgi:hypothetical protein